MLRSSKHILKYQTNFKTNNLDKLFEIYQKDIQMCINLLWDKKIPCNKYMSTKLLKNIEFGVQHSNWKALIYKEASSCIRRNEKQKNKSKPIIKKLVITLDGNLFNLNFESKEFDEFIKIRLPWFGTRRCRLGFISEQINIPIKYHKYSNKYKDNNWKRKNTIQLSKINDNYYVTLFWEKEDIPKNFEGKSIGIDQGYKNLLVTSNNEFIGKDFDKLHYIPISKKKQNSKNFKQSLIYRNNEINRLVNSIDLTNIKQIVIEDLHNVKKSTKGKLRKEFVNKLQRWVYSKTVKKLERYCEENGVLLTKVEPAYTSQTCSKCRTIDKQSRKGPLFKCSSCGIVIDADYNASINILHRGVYDPSNKKIHLESIIIGS